MRRTYFSTPLIARWPSVVTSLEKQSETALEPCVQYYDFTLIAIVSPRISSIPVLLHFQVLESQAYDSISRASTETWKTSRKFRPMNSDERLATVQSDTRSFEIWTEQTPISSLRIDWFSCNLQMRILARTLTWINGEPSTIFPS